MFWTPLWPLSFIAKIAKVLDTLLPNCHVEREINAIGFRFGLGARQRGSVSLGKGLGEGNGTHAVFHSPPSKLRAGEGEDFSDTL